MGGSTQRTIIVFAASIFAAFGITAFIFRQMDVSDETLSIVGGVCAYLFLAVTAVILLRAWRAKGRDASAAAVAFVRLHPLVASSVGTPVHVGEPEGDIPAGAGPAQANLDVVVTGPDGIAQVDLVMARISRRWEVLSATLVSEGARVPLREGPHDTV